MAGESTVSSKGQITIPIEVRRRLGLAPGTKVVIEVEGDHAVLKAVANTWTDRLSGLGAELWATEGGAEAHIQAERDAWDG